MSIITKTASALVFLAAFCFAQESNSSESDDGSAQAMEIGGNVLVDYASDMSDFSKPVLQIGQVELGAKINISDQVVASVVLKTWDKLDSLWIDQALVSYTPGTTPFEFLFGQQTFNYGLLTTRMISDPEIYDLVDFREPGLILNGATELLTGGLGFTVLRQIDSLPVGPFVDPFYDTLMLYTSIVNVDLNLPNESIVRLSSLINQKNIGLDFAANINAGKISLDAELFSTVKSLDSAKPSGGYLGLLCQVTDRFGIAARADALAADGLTKMGMRYGLGATFDIKDGIFFSIEYGRLVPYKETVSNEIGFEFGLERRISLPGFQRKNLSRD